MHADNVAFANGLRREHVLCEGAVLTLPPTGPLAVLPSLLSKSNWARDNGAGSQAAGAGQAYAREFVKSLRD